MEALKVKVHLYAVYACQNDNRDTLRLFWLSISSVYCAARIRLHVGWLPWCFAFVRGFHSADDRKVGPSQVGVNVLLACACCSMLGDVPTVAIAV